MRYVAILIIAALSAGCQNLVTQKMAAQDEVSESKDIYIACLKAHAGDDSACALEKKIFDANVSASQNIGANPAGVLVHSSK